MVERCSLRCGIIWRLTMLAESEPKCTTTRARTFLCVKQSHLTSPSCSGQMQWLFLAPLHEFLGVQVACAPPSACDESSCRKLPAGGFLLACRRLPVLHLCSTSDNHHLVQSFLRMHGKDPRKYRGHSALVAKADKVRHL